MRNLKTNMKVLPKNYTNTLLTEHVKDWESSYYLITFYNPGINNYEMMLWEGSIASWVIEEAHLNNFILINYVLLTKGEYIEIKSRSNGDY